MYKNEEEWEKVIFGLFEGYTPQFQAKINSPREKLMDITLTLYRFVPTFGTRGPIFLCIYKKYHNCQYPWGFRLWNYFQLDVLAYLLALRASISDC